MSHMTSSLLGTTKVTLSQLLSISANRILFEVVEVNRTLVWTKVRICAIGAGLRTVTTTPKSIIVFEAYDEYVGN